MVRTCDFCYRMCELKEGQRGVCGIREHREGGIVTVNYGYLLAAAVDPIEKKPMYHFCPGEKTLSVALFGCNFSCTFCQNHDLSQRDSELFPASRRQLRGEYTSAEMLVRKMKECGVSIMSYTYSDPVVWQDYMLDTAKIVHEQEGLNCMVTNGSFSGQSLKRVLPYIDGINIDVKGDDQFYRTYCKGALSPVMKAVEAFTKRPGTVLEVTTLLIEGIHTLEDVRLLGAQLCSAGVQVWHLSRFFPHYHMEERRATSEEFLDQAIEIAREAGIPYVYGGNTGNPDHGITRCPSCGRQVVTRRGYYVRVQKELQQSMLMNMCIECGQRIYGVFR